MIPTFVITLREGVEASLIVGIIAAFLVKEGRQDALRQMWVGVAIAIVLCTAVGVGLDLVGEQLPQKEQEGLETIVGADRGGDDHLHDHLDDAATRGGSRPNSRARRPALAPGSAMALVGMAFLAVLREGFETSVFLLAAFQDATDTTAAGAGAMLGLVAAVAIGLGLYRGGVRINLTQLLPDHRPDPRLRRRRPAGHRRPHRPRGGLDQQLPGAGGRPDLAGQPGNDLRLAADRDARAAAGADRDRGVRLSRSTRSRWRSTCSGRDRFRPARREHAAKPSAARAAAETPA